MIIAGLSCQGTMARADVPAAVTSTFSYDDSLVARLDAFLPVFEDDSSALFGLARISSRTDDELTALGIGYRRFVGSTGVLGVNAVIDTTPTRTAIGSEYRQMSVGLEYLGRDIDFRMTGYDIVEENIATIQTGSAIIATTAGPARAVLVNQAIVVQRDISEMVQNDFASDRALSGFDGEIGWRVPLRPVEAATQLRVYGGGYAFSGRSGGDVSGYTARAELRVDEPLGLIPGSQFTVGAAYVSDDRNDGRGLVSVAFRLPLQGSRSNSAPTWRTRRLSDHVERRDKVLTRAIRTTDTFTRSGGTVNEAAVLAEDGRALDRVAVVGSGDDLQATVNTLGAGGVVILDGVHTVNTTITLPDSDARPSFALIGGNQVVAVQGAVSGTVVSYTTPGARGVLDINVPSFGAGVVLGRNSVVQGVDFLGRAGSQATAARLGGFLRATTGQILFRDVTISNVRAGIDTDSEDGVLTLDNVRMTDIAGQGVRLPRVLFTGKALGATNVTFDRVGTAIAAVGRVDLTDVTVRNAINGVSNLGGFAALTIDGGVFDTISGVAIAGGAGASGPGTMMLTDIVIRNVDGTGISVAASPEGTGSAILNNVLIDGGAGRGIDIVSRSASVNLNAINLSIRGLGSDAIRIDDRLSQGATVSLSGFAVSDIGGDVINSANGQNPGSMLTIRNMTAGGAIGGDIFHFAQLGQSAVDVEATATGVTNLGGVRCHGDFSGVIVIDAITYQNGAPPCQ